MDFTLTQILIALLSCLSVLSVGGGLIAWEMARRNARLLEYYRHLDHDVAVQEVDKSGRVRYANRHAQQIWQGRSLLEALKEKLDEDLYEAVVGLGEEAPSSLELVWRDRGRPFRYVISTQPIKRGILWSALPASGKSQSGLPENSLQLIKRFLEACPQGALVLNADEMVIYANPAFHAEVGKTLSLPLPLRNLRKASRLSDDADEELWEIDCGGSETEGFDAQTIALETQDSDRQIVFLSKRAKPTAGMTSVEVGSEELWKRAINLLEAAPIGIAELDEQGLLIGQNTFFLDLLELDAKAAEGLPFLELGGGESKTALQEAWAKISSGSDMVTCELEISGSAPRNLSLVFQSLEEEKGVIIFATDISEQRNLEAQFAQSQKMQAIGQLAGGVAHDFNNLLTAMIGFCDLLLLRHRPGDQSFGDVMQIKQNANRAANLVRQLLAFSRQQTLQPRVLNVTDILSELSHLLRRLIGESIELKLIHGRDLGQIKADQGQLEQVIINLVVNARDAMQGGGKVTISTRNVSFEGERKLGSEELPAGDYLQIEISDTGKGIPPEIITRIFDPFFSTKEVGEGTGLGLSTVYGIVRQTGGVVTVDSVVGQGTVFRVYLPHFHVEDLQEEESVQEEIRRDLTGAETIMLVEDETAVRAFSSRALRSKGYEVIEASSGESALAILRGEGEEPIQPERIDLLVSDVVMPRVDGPTLVKEARQMFPDLKVIFISGYAESSFRDRVGEEKDLHFLPKPFSLKDLAEKVKEVLGS